MRAAQFIEVGQPLRLAEVDKPTAEAGGLVFKVKACGICASDLHAAEVPGLLQHGNVPASKGGGWEIVSSRYPRNPAVAAPHARPAALPNAVKLSCKVSI